MRLLTKEELKNCTEAELWDLYRRLLLLLPTLREGSLDHLNVLTNLVIIREAIARRAQPRPG